MTRCLLSRFPEMTNDSCSKFVADAPSVRQQFLAMGYADAGSVGHGDANLELLNDEIPNDEIMTKLE